MEVSIQLLLGCCQRHFASCLSERLLEHQQVPLRRVWHSISYSCKPQKGHVSDHSLADWNHHVLMIHRTGLDHDQAAFTGAGLQSLLLEWKKYLVRDIEEWWSVNLGRKAALDFWVEWVNSFNVINVQLRLNDFADGTHSETWLSILRFQSPNKRRERWKKVKNKPWNIHRVKTQKEKT